MSLITQSEWARTQGFSPAYVNKLVKSGKIVLVNGRVDPADANKRLSATRNTVKQAHKAATHAKANQHSQPFEFVGRSRQRESSEDRGGSFEGPEDYAEDEIPRGDLADHLLRARIKTEREAGRLKKLARLEREKQLVDAEEIRRAQLRRASAERDALMAWPRRIASDMAADLGVDDRLMLQTLQRYIRQHLTERSTVKTVEESNAAEDE